MNDSQSTNPINQMATDELLRNLGRFPAPVLPTGVLRELQSRGNAIHDSLVALINEAIDSIGDGLRYEPRSAFFAFALLVPLATKDDQPLIESVLTLPEESIDFLFGDLIGEAMAHMVANLFQDQSASDVTGWINRLADDPKVESLNSGVLFRGIRLAAARGDLDRNTAIDALVHRLEQRDDQRNDTQSATIVCELMDLSAAGLEEANAVVRASFQRGQIDLDFVELASWDDSDSLGEFDSQREIYFDPASAISTWCYEFVSDDLDPVDAAYRFNEQSSQRLLYSEESSVVPLVAQLRQATADHFPHAVVDLINSRFAEAYPATIDLIREELARYQSAPESWSGNGAYLGLVLTVANKMPLPTDLLQTLLQMPVKDREGLIGDQFGLIPQAVALTPQRQYDFIEQWIRNTEHNAADRREMVDCYLHGYHNCLIDREWAIKTLADGLRRALDDDQRDTLAEVTLLIGAYAENLAFFTPQEHKSLLEEAFKRDDAIWFMPLDVVRRVAKDADFAMEQFQNRKRSYRSVQQIVKDGIMFETDPYVENSQPEPRRVPAYQPPSQPQPPPQPAPETTIRSDDRTPRNALCPCGSGKKYKKCCLTK